MKNALLRYLALTLAITAASFAIGHSFAAKQAKNHSEVTREMSPRLPETLTAEILEKPIHYALLSWNRDFYEKAYKRAEEPSMHARTHIYGALVNHHLLAPHLIARVFKAISSNEPKIVVLISPDHFFRGDTFVTTSHGTWHTPYGDLEAHTPIIRKLAKSEYITIANDPFTDEHGISGIVSFIKKSLPNAEVVPLIVKESTPKLVIDALAKTLHTELPQDAIVIGSFDFSHTLPAHAAEFHDVTSVSTLLHFDFERVDTLDIDAQRGLRLLLHLMMQKDADHFTLFDNTNAAEFLNIPTLADTTSYITGIFTHSTGRRFDNQVTLLAFGDMMLDRYVRKAITEKGERYPFEPLTRLFMGNDIVVSNLEGTITNFPPKPLSGQNFTFTFDPAIVEELQRIGFSAVGLANNHSDDFGKEGIEQTKKYLKEAGISYFGDFANEKEVSRVIEIRGTRVALVGYHALGGRKPRIIIEEIARLESLVDYTVVFPHWGIEYRAYFSTSEQEIAHEFIDAGADIILGSHPHVIQPIELYNNRLIFYSLGNFIFDQTFSEQTTKGLAVGVVFGKDTITAYLFPTEITGFQVSLTEYGGTGILLKEIAQQSAVPDLMKTQIESGKITHHL